LRRLPRSHKAVRSDGKDDVYELTVASGGSAQQQEVRDPGCERARLRPSGGAHAGEELVDLDTQGIGLMLELAGVVAHHVRGLPGLAGRVGEAGDLLAHHAGALGNGRDVMRHLTGRRVLLLDR